MARRVSANAGTPTGCVRGSPAYISKSDCEMNKPSGEVCNPRYINGAWDRFSPYARDSVACGGALPPPIAPQVLNDASLVQATGWEALSQLSLTLMQDGHIGSFQFTVLGTAGAQTVHFDQGHLVQELDMPLMYVYAVPHASGVMRLTLNLTSGRASVSWPIDAGFGSVTYSLSTI